MVARDMGDRWHGEIPARSIASGEGVDGGWLTGRTRDSRPACRGAVDGACRSSSRWGSEARARQSPKEVENIAIADIAVKHRRPFGRFQVAGLLCSHKNAQALANQSPQIVSEVIAFFDAWVPGRLRFR